MSMSRKSAVVAAVAAVFLIVSAIVVSVLVILPADDMHLLNITEVKDYLAKYGYMERNGTNKDDMDQAIKEFQKMAGMKPSGSLDTETEKMMMMPRCGMSDKKATVTPRGFSAPDGGWPKKKLSYRVTAYPSSTLSKEQVDQEVARAFDVWTSHTDLEFSVMPDGIPDINIRFVEGGHGDGASNAFDGPSGVLAHAFSPTDGRAHFDDAEEWSVASDAGTNLFQVAAHEFGHNLGLGHSEVKAALMAPFYNGYQPDFRLHEDDIQGIQSLYGSRALCQKPMVDTIFTDLNDVTYLITGQKFWTLDSAGVSNSFPGDVQTLWPGLPACVDAAFEHPEIGKTYFFSGGSFWRYQNNTLDDGYPMPISKRFPGIPDNVDSAFVWPKNEQIYFFKGGDFWRFDYTATPNVDAAYPRRISQWWRGVSDAPDAAFVGADGQTYFAKGGSYTKINDSKRGVLPQVDVEGPKSISTLLGCGNVAGDSAGSTFTVSSSDEVIMSTDAMDRLMEKPDVTRCKPSCPVM